MLPCFLATATPVPMTTGHAVAIEPRRFLAITLSRPAWIPELGMYYYKARIYSPPLLVSR